VNLGGFVDRRPGEAYDGRVGVDWGSVPDWVGAVGSTIALAVTGYVLTNRLALRDKRRDVRVEYLLSAFRRLDASGNRHLDLDAEYARQLETALADIVLLGSPLQVRLAQEVMVGMGTRQNADLTPLLEDLRRHLRQELSLEPDETRYKFLRIRTPADEAKEAAAIRLGDQLRADGGRSSDSARKGNDGGLAQSRPDHGSS
jgi:hypothetical protein